MVRMFAENQEIVEGFYLRCASTHVCVCVHVRMYAYRCVHVCMCVKCWQHITVV